jgi:hypothetical protein
MDNSGSISFTCTCHFIIGKAWHKYSNNNTSDLAPKTTKKVAQPEDDPVLADLQPVGGFLSDNGTELLYYILI